MRSELQRQASRINGAKSSGPADRSRVRFNGLKHGLRSEHVDVTLPGESREEFDADRRAWFDDWRPLTHTRAVLVERAVIANWKLKRAGRFERARAYDLAADADHEFNLTVKGVVEGGQNLLPRFPAEGLSRLRSHSAGLDCLIGLWEDLAGAAESGWTSRTDHHDRLLNLLGHVAGKEPGDLEAARASLVLLRAHGAIAEGPAPGASDVAEARATPGALCAGRAEEFRRERSQYQDPEAYRLHLIDVAAAPTSKEAQLLHRYEREHEKSLYAAIRGLLALEKSGADLPDEPEPEPPAPPEAVMAAGPVTPEKCDISVDSQKASGEPASADEAGSSGSLGAASGSLGEVESGPARADGNAPGRGRQAPPRGPSGGPGARSRR